MALSAWFSFFSCWGTCSGNLQIFLGADVINAYAYKLHHLLPASALWGIRLFLLGTIAVHIWAAISLTLDNRKARPQSYDDDKPMQASLSCAHDAHERYHFARLHHLSYRPLHGRVLCRQWSIGSRRAFADGSAACETWPRGHERRRTLL